MTTDPPENDVMADGTEHPGHPHETRFLRQLDGCEEYFWLRQQSIQVQHVTAVRVRGRVSLTAWQAAWQSLHDRYAMLSARIQKQPGTRPAFFSTGSSSPLTIKPWNADLDLCDEVAAELEEPLGDGGKGLMRLTLFHDPEETVLLLTAHHSAADGKTSLLLLEDLLAAVAGEHQEGRVPWLSLSSLLDQPVLLPYAEASTPDAYGIADAAQPGRDPLQVSHAFLTTSQTHALRENTRREETTVHGALVAAFAFTLGPRLQQVEYPPAGTEAAINCISPVDQRVLTGALRAAGTPITFPALAVPYGAAHSFWDVARWVHYKLKAPRTRDGAIQSLATLGRICTVERTPSQLNAVLKSNPVPPGLVSPGFMLTNLGSYRFRTGYEGLHVIALMSAVNSGAAPMQTISVSTTDDRLGMTHISRMPVPNLLEEAKERLLGAQAL